MKDYIPFLIRLLNETKGDENEISASDLAKIRKHQEKHKTRRNKMSEMEMLDHWQKTREDAEKWRKGLEQKIKNEEIDLSYLE